MTAQKASPMHVLGFLLPASLVIFLILYFFSISTVVKKFSLITLAVLAGLTLSYYILHFTSSLRRVTKILHLAEHGSLKQKKALYLDIYNLYLKLSKRNKWKIYFSIEKLRKDIELQIHSAKQVETLSQQAGQGSLKQQQKAYEKMHGHYRRLSPEQQHKWYHHLVHFRHRLERGR